MGGYGLPLLSEGGTKPTYTHIAMEKWDKYKRGPGFTRPDGILANKIAADVITAFLVRRDSTLPSHLPLEVRMQVERLDRKIYTIEQPRIYPLESVPEETEGACVEKALECVEAKE